MKRSELLFSAICTIGLTLTGCTPKEDLKPLQDETAKLVEQAKMNNDSIDTNTKALNICKTEHSDVADINAIITEPAPFEIPILTGGDTVVGLKEYKDAMIVVLQKQEEKLKEVKKGSEDCTKELAEAKAKVASAANKTNAQKKATKKSNDSAAVENAKEAGTATKGVKSRYKTRTP